MPFPSRFVSLLLTSTTLLHLTTAFITFSDSTVAYLTNCQTSDTLAVYSEVSLYSDVDQSWAGQGPDAYDDTPLGAVTTWEGATVTWFYAGSDPDQADAFDESINTNAQDPAIPTFDQVGCAGYTLGSGDGGAVLFKFACYKDQPRVLYTTSDHECSTVYYCRMTEDVCPLMQPSGATKLVEQSKEL